MYPSISICKKYSFEKELFSKRRFPGTSDYDISGYVKSVIQNFSKYSLALDDQVYFFTHPGVMNLTFPCTTTRGGISPGKPCIFPVTWILWPEAPVPEGTTTIEVTGCRNLDLESGSDEIWDRACYTKVFDNNTVDSNTGTDYFWGNCPKKCKNEVSSPSSPYNLAKGKYTHLWTSAFYDLGGWENGYCHTYDPPHKSAPDFLQRLYFMIAKKSYYRDYDIFLHEKGQFWPRTEMRSFGQPEGVTLSDNREIKIVFSVKEVTRISTKERPCVKDQNYSFTKCLQDYVINEVGCSFDLLGKEGENKANCSRREFFRYFYLLTKIKLQRISTMNKETGCYPKCKIIQYTIDETKERDDNTDQTSNVSQELYHIVN